MQGGKIPLTGIDSEPEVELLDLLGTGTFGTVWKVRDTSSRKLFVLKIIQGIRPDSNLADRVRNEASVSIPSEYIVSVLGLCEWNPSTFLILFEYFPAINLSLYLEKTSPSPEEKESIFRQILQGVSDAHLHNVIHRDIKPDNILVGANLVVKLIDFGVSRFKSKDVTMTGESMGTPLYMPPETFINPEGSKNADARVDIYALGQILYELAMGETFWSHKGLLDLKDFFAYLSQIPKPETCIDCGDFRCDFNPRAKDVLPRMIMIDPMERIASVEAVMEALGYYQPQFLEPLPSLPFSYPMLIVESGSNQGARTLISLESNQKQIMGRADIAGGDRSISSRHLRFTRSGERYLVEDLGSKNGTMVRGLSLRPNESIELHHGDRIKMGEVFLRFVFTYS